MANLFIRGPRTVSHSEAGETGERFFKRATLGVFELTSLRTIGA
jgi:hypothetical protein